MRLFRILLAVATVATAVFALGPGTAFGQSEQFIPRLVYRTGPYAPNGIPFADGYADYLDMIDARDGGVGGVKITYEECETGYNNDKGVECYERLKNKGPTGASLVDPLSTGITYALIERATADKIPVVSMGYGRADASDGAVFPYVFTLPATYWTQADAMIKYIGEQMGGLDKLKGKKIGLVYIDIAYGKEPIATLEKLSQKYGYTFVKYPVSAPGIEQSATLVHGFPPSARTAWAAERGRIPGGISRGQRTGGHKKGPPDNPAGRFRSRAACVSAAATRRSGRLRRASQAPAAPATRSARACAPAPGR